MSAKRMVPCLVAAIAVFAMQSATVLAEETKTSAPATKTEIKEAAQKAPADPVAKINGTVITKKELDRAVKVLIAQNRLPQNLPADQLKDAESAALEQLISAELIYQAGQKAEIKDLDKQIETKIAQNRAKFPSTEEFEKALKTVEMTDKDLKEFTRKDIVITTFIENSIVSKVTVAEADAKKFYDDNIDKFKQDESVKASHILIGVDAKASDDEKKKAKEKAEGLLKKIKAGEDFATLAKTESTCPSGKQGGDLGQFGKGQMVPPFEKVAFALKPGEVSDVVETQFGYHIIKLTEKQEGGTTKYDDVKARIMDYLKNTKIQKGVNDYLEELKKTAKIERL